MKSLINRVIAHRATNYPNVVWMWKDFCREHHSEIASYERYDSFRTVMINGDVHYFVPTFKWNEWTRGRTYWVDGELWHSDFKLKESGSGEL